jgi:hypothetical protein
MRRQFFNYLRVALSVCLLGIISQNLVATTTEEDHFKKTKQCMDGLPPDTPLTNLTLMHLNFGSRTTMPNSRCTAEFNINGYTGGVRATVPKDELGCVENLICQICGSKSYDGPRLIGERDVLKVSVENDGKKDLLKLDLTPKNDNNNLIMNCWQEEKYFDGLSTCAQEKNSGRSFINALEKSHIPCVQQKLPEKAELQGPPYMGTDK